MPKTKITNAHLTNDKLSKKGKYLVVELIEDHEQNGCEIVPAGTRGIIVASYMKEKEHAFLFPHDVLPNDLKVWSDGHIRIIKNYKPLGRIDHT